MKFNLEAKLVNEQIIDIREIKNIFISYTSDTVNLYKVDSDKVILKEYMNYEPEKEELANITINNNKLIIESGERMLKIFNYLIRKIEIYIPSNYANDFEIMTSSGSIKSDESFKFSDFKATSKSGSIKLKDICANNINAQASSGSIVMENANGNRIFKTSSGSIKVLNGCGDSIFSSSSGSITVNNMVGKLEASASSGSVKATINELNNDIDISVSSGSANITLPPSSSFKLNAQTSSGSIKTYFDNQLFYNKKGNQASGVVGDNPTISINVKTSSGSVKINNI